MCKKRSNIKTLNLWNVIQIALCPYKKIVFYDIYLIGIINQYTTYTDKIRPFEMSILYTCTESVTKILHLNNLSITYLS